MFGAKAAENRLISRGTAIIFTLSVVGGLIVFGNRYSGQPYLLVDDTSPLATGFWSSRVSAHPAGCGHGRLRRGSTYVSGRTGVRRERDVLYVTDGVLAILIAGLFCTAASSFSLGWTVDALGQGEEPEASGHVAIDGHIRAAFGRPAMFGGAKMKSLTEAIAVLLGTQLVLLFLFSLPALACAPAPTCWMKSSRQYLKSVAPIPAIPRHAQACRGA